MSEISEKYTPPSDAIHVLSWAEIPEEEVTHYWFFYLEKMEGREDYATTTAGTAEFVKFAKAAWQKDSQRREEVLPQNWRPQVATIDHLEMLGVNRSFAAGRVGEFCIYWRDRGEPRANWDRTFYHHVKNRWARHKKA